MDELERKLVKAKKIQKLPKLIIPVHFAGRPVDMGRLNNLKKYNFSIIEDASMLLVQNIRMEWLVTVNFQILLFLVSSQVKIITTGEGGAITTNNKTYFNKLNLLINNGITKNKKFFKSKKKNPDWYYEQHIVGGNYRMSDIQSALGMSQLKSIKIFLKWRRKIAKKYLKFFEKFPDIIHKIEIDLIRHFIYFQS